MIIGFSTLNVQGVKVYMHYVLPDDTLLPQLVHLSHLLYSHDQSIRTR